MNILMIQFFFWDRWELISVAQNCLEVTPFTNSLGIPNDTTVTPTVFTEVTCTAIYGRNTAAAKSQFQSSLLLSLYTL